VICAAILSAGCNGSTETGQSNAKYIISIPPPSPRLPNAYTCLGGGGRQTDVQAGTLNADHVTSSLKYTPWIITYWPTITLQGSIQTCLITSCLQVR